MITAEGDSCVTIPSGALVHMGAVSSLPIIIISHQYRLKFVVSIIGSIITGCEMILLESSSCLHTPIVHAFQHEW